MAFTIKELREANDDVLISLHDKVAVHTRVGTAYYLDEIQRRDRERAMEASHKLAVASFWMTAANSVLAVAAVVIALLA